MDTLDTGVMPLHVAIERLINVADLYCRVVRTGDLPLIKHTFRDLGAAVDSVTLARDVAAEHAAEVGRFPLQVVASGDGAAVAGGTA